MNWVWSMMWWSGLRYHPYAGNKHLELYVLHWTARTAGQKNIFIHPTLTTMTALITFFSLASWGCFAYDYFISCIRAGIYYVGMCKSFMSSPTELLPDWTKLTCGHRCPMQLSHFKGNWCLLFWLVKYWLLNGLPPDKVLPPLPVFGKSLYNIATVTNS